jgi:hypothetical protein
LRDTHYAARATLPLAWRELIKDLAAQQHRSEAQTLALLVEKGLQALGLALP